MVKALPNATRVALKIGERRCDAGVTLPAVFVGGRGSGIEALVDPIVELGSRRVSGCPGRMVMSLVSAIGARRRLQR